MKYFLARSPEGVRLGCVKDSEVEATELREDFAGWTDDPEEEVDVEVVEAIPPQPPMTVDLDIPPVITIVPPSTVPEKDYHYFHVSFHVRARDVFEQFLVRAETSWEAAAKGIERFRSLQPQTYGGGIMDWSVEVEHVSDSRNTIL